MTDHVGHQPVALRGVHDLADQRTGLDEVVVVLVRRVRGARELATCVPFLHVGIAHWVGLWTTLRIGGVDRVGDVLDPHCPVLAVAVNGCLRCVDRNLLVVHAEPCPVGVGIGEQPTQQHLVRAWTDAGNEIVGFERGLLDLGVEVRRVPVECQLANFDQRVVTVRPDLGQVERIEAIGLGFIEGHDLHLERPARVRAPHDRLEQIPAVEVGVRAGDRVSLRLAEVFDALVGLEVILHPEPLLLRIDPHVGVAGVAVHVPPGSRDPAVSHQPGHLVRRLGRQRPEVPLHVVVAEAGIGPAFLGTDEVLELHRVADEEHRRVVPHHVVVALGGVELEGKAPRVAPGIRAALFTGHRREAQRRVRPGALLEDRGLGVHADVLGHSEVAECTAPLGMRLPLGNPLPVEVRHLLDEIVILQQDRTVGTNGQRVLVARYGDSRVGCRRLAILFLHGVSPLCVGCGGGTGRVPEGSTCRSARFASSGISIVASLVFNIQNSFLKANHNLDFWLFSPYITI